MSAVNGSRMRWQGPQVLAPPTGAAQRGGPSEAAEACHDELGRRGDSEFAGACAGRLGGASDAKCPNGTAITNLSRIPYGTRCGCGIRRARVGRAPPDGCKGAPSATLTGTQSGQAL